MAVSWGGRQWGKDEPAHFIGPVPWAFARGGLGPCLGTGVCPAVADRFLYRGGGGECCLDGGVVGAVAVLGGGAAVCAFGGCALMGRAAEACDKPAFDAGFGVFAVARGGRRA